MQQLQNRSGFKGFYVILSEMSNINFHNWRKWIIVEWLANRIKSKTRLVRPLYKSFQDKVSSILRRTGKKSTLYVFSLLFYKMTSPSFTL